MVEVVLKPEQELFLRERVENGRFATVDEALGAAVLLLEEREKQSAANAEIGRLNLVEVFAPLRGANLEFPRDKSLLRPFDL